MAARAVRRVREMVASLRVAAEAARTLSAGRGAVTGVAAIAVAVLGHAMQAGELVFRVAGGTRRSAYDAAGTVRAMALIAPLRELPVSRLRFFGMAARASAFRRRTAVLVVTARARLVSRRRRPVLLRVAGLAVGADRTAVRLVTTRTALVPGMRTLVHGCMAAVAADFAPGGMVRQPRVTRRTRGVPGQRGGTMNLLSVTRGAELFVRAGDPKLMRRVATFAGDTTVKLLVRRRCLMATAALARNGVHGARTGMRLVAAHARAGNASLRMIGVNVRMTAGARLLRRAAHVVRCVTGAAAGMCGHARRRKHGHALVAGAALTSRLSLEVVRAVAADALLVSVREHGAGRYFRLFSCVTFGTAFQSFGRRRVLVLVTRPTRFVAALAVRRVRRLHFRVAFRACCGGRPGVLVRLMALHALAGAVHRHRGGTALITCVAAGAVGR